MKQDFMVALDALQEEKNIDKKELLDAIETSIISAYQKNYKTNNDVKVNIDPESGEITVYEPLEVVEEITEPNQQISLEEAKKIDEKLQIGDIYQKSITPKDFGRIAAQNAKQLIVQRIKDAERNLVYDEFVNRVDEIVNGTVERVERGNVFVNLGMTEALLPISEQVSNETYKHGQRLKVYLLSVRKTPKGPQLKVSRSHPGLIKRLFEEEVPEIYDGTIDIINVSREPGLRSKIAVKSNDKTIDPVGSCVGQKGVRVQNIIEEINNEKIDVINYSDDYVKYIENALSPAKIEKIIANNSEKNAIVIVDDNQLSLAIGKEGQNVRLAAKLTGWKIDIKSETAYNELLKENPDFEVDFLESSKSKDVESIDDIPDILFEDDLFKVVDDTDEDASIDELIKSDNDALDDLFE